MRLVERFALIVILFALATADAISDAEDHLDDPVSVDIAPTLRAAVAASAASWPLWALWATSLGAVFAACALALLLYGAIVSGKAAPAHGSMPPDAFFIAGAIVLVVGCVLIVVPVTLVLTAAPPQPLA